MSSMISPGESIAAELVELEKGLRELYRRELEDLDQCAQAEERIKAEIEAREEELINACIQRSTLHMLW